MKKLFQTLVAALLLNGCSQVDYRINKSTSNPYGGVAFNVDNDRYEFRSRIFANIDGEEVYVAELAHLSFYENAQELSDGVWKSSRLRFVNLSTESRFTLVPTSINIQHSVSDGGIIRPLRVESKITECPDNINCGTYTLRYGRLNPNPELLRERVAFTILVDGEEKHFDHIFTLERAKSGSFLDALKGV